MKLFQIIYLMFISLFENDEKPARLNKKTKREFKLTKDELIILVFIIVFITLFITSVIYVGIHGSLESTQYYYRLI